MDPARVLLAMHFGNPIFKGLKHLAKSIGISRIVLGHRTANDDVQGSYFRPGVPAESVVEAFEGWAWSEGQKTAIRTALARGNAAILVNHPRLDEYCLQNRDEAYAEAFSIYLSGQPMRKINLRPMLRRACMNDTRSFSLLRNYRKSVA